MKLTMNLYKLLFVAAFFTIGNRIQAQTVIPGEMPTSYDVSASGAFQYTVPLRIPPGIKDMVPSLSINYNSQSGDGNLGMGWSLSGLSAITRGMPTIHHDQTLGAVDFNSDDVFFLDGQRLFWETSTSSYLTEVKNFATIKSWGTAGSGPSYFTVTYPNGTVYEYGNSTSSKMLAQGKSDVLMWPVNKIMDVHGNYITFEYTNQPSTGEYRILQIVYGQNSGNSNSIPITIDFNFNTSRQYANTAYVKGSGVLNNKLLTDISIKFSNWTSPNPPASQYVFSYDQSELHPRLTKIEEFRNGTHVMEPININWGDYSDNYNDNVTTTDVNTSNRTVMSGDFNGDGFSDFVGFHYNSTNTQMEIFLNDHKTNPGDFIQAQSMSVAFYNIVYAPTRLTFDYDGDGMDDVILLAKGQTPGGAQYINLLLLRANGNSTTVFDSPVSIHYSENTSNNNSNFANDCRFIPGDFDGDGISEIFIIEPHTFHNNGLIDYHFRLAGFHYTSLVSGHYEAHTVYYVANLLKVEEAMALDNDGDGRNEFMYNTVNSTAVFTGRLKLTYSGTTPQLIQTPTSWPIEWLNMTNFPNSNFRTWVGDFNGDGKTDVISWDEVSTGNPWSLAYGDGVWPFYGSRQVVTSTSHPLSNLHVNGPWHTGNGDYSYFTADFNGDGLTDILQVYRDIDKVQCDYDIFYSTGGSFIHQPFSDLPVDADERQSCLGDFNGDGQVDILCGRTLSNIKYATFRRNDGSLKVISIEHANKTVNTEYTTIPQDASYVKILPTNNNFLGRTLPLKVAKRIYDGIALDNAYTYEGFTFHKYGMGMRGVKKFTVKNIVNQKIYQTFELESTIPYLKEQKTFDALGLLSYAALTTYTQHDYPGGAGGRSRIINTTSTTIDNITGQIVENTIVTGSTSSGTVFYDFGQVESTSVRSKDLLGGNNSLQTTTYNYGANWATLKGKPESVTVYSDIDPAGINGITRSTEYTYYANGEVHTVKTDPGTPNEKVTDFTYNGYGNLIQKDLTATGVSGTITNTYTYTIDGKFLLTEANTLGYTTTYNYGNLAATWGNPVSKTDYKGITRQYTYDAVNRLIVEKDVASGIETHTTYNWASSSGYDGGLANAQMFVGVTNTYDADFSYTIYDKYGRVVREIGPVLSWVGDLRTDYTYGVNGKLQTVYGPYDPALLSLPITTTTYDYDSYSREIQRSTDHGGATIQTSYAISSGVLHTTVSNWGAGTWKKSITCGKTLRSVISSGTPNQTIDYTYHGNGTTATTTVNASSPMNGMGPAKDFINTVDAYGRVTSTQQPNAGTVSYDYDALDRVTREIRANGTVYDYTYDLLGRVRQKLMSGQATPYTYIYEDMPGVGTTGELTQETSPNGHFKDYAYTNEGWPQSVKEDNLFETIYGYYPNGDLRYYTFNNDLTIEYDYYAGIVTDATLLGGALFPSNQKLWNRWGINPNGQQTSAYFFDITNQPLYADLREFDVHGLLKTHEVVNNNFGVTNIVENKYSFDPHTGNLMWRKDNMPMRNHTEYFTYDNDYDQLKTISQSINGGPTNQVLSMTYDMHGNIRKKDDVAPALAHLWKYDDYALETIEMPSAPPFPPTVAIPHFTQDIVYTPFEKVETMREHNNNEVVFTYGADDNRFSATYNDLTGGGGGSLYKTKYYYQNHERTDYLTSSVELFYVWAGDELVAILKRDGTSGDIYYPIRDHLGSITHLLDITGTGGMAANGILEERSFDAWGRTRDPNNWMPYPIGGHPGFWITDRGYTGHEHIWMPTFSNMYDNNIINMDGRLYDPQVGRMFSPDPFIPDGTNAQDYNKYVYARNNPLKYNDPDGNVVWPAMAIGAVVGGFSGYQIGKAYGAKGLDMAAYIVGGALIGAVSGGMGSAITTTGGIMANTMGIAASSVVYTTGMSMLSGGAIQPTANFGFGSYNLETGKFNYLLDGDNEWYEDLGYAFGAMANLQDLVAGINGVNVSVSGHATADDKTGHSAIYDKNGKIDISVAGPPWRARNTGFQNEVDYVRDHINMSKGRYLQSYTRGSRPVNLYNVNGRWLETMTDNIKNKIDPWGPLFGKLQYGLGFGCMNHTSRALLGVGVLTIPGINWHPWILNAQLLVRQAGMYASPYLTNMK